MEVSGLSQLKRKLHNMQSLEDDVSYIMKQNSIEAPERMINVARDVMNKGYWTGNLARLIRADMDSKLKFTLASNAYYSGFVNYGTRYMEAEPFLFLSAKQVEGRLRADFNRLMKTY